MRPLGPVAAVLLLSLTVPANAQYAGCATSTATIERAEQLDEWSQLRMQQLRGKGAVAPQSTVRGNVLMLQRCEGESLNTAEMVGHDQRAGQSTEFICSKCKRGFVGVMRRSTASIAQFPVSVQMPD